MPLDGSFTAIDFETANYARHSICQIGLARFENGRVVHTINQLVKPPGNEYNYYNVRVHGITPDKTEDAPDFDAVWGHMKPFVQDQLLVAHNMVFDKGCLLATLAYYDLAVPRFDTHCTFKIYKRGLGKLAIEHQIPLNHHDALSDALACGHLFQKHLLMELGGIQGILPILST